MKEIFILNSSLIPAELQNAIDDRMAKIKSLVSSVLLADETCVDYTTLYGVFWTINDLLEEVSTLYTRLEHPINIHR